MSDFDEALRAYAESQPPPRGGQEVLLAALRGLDRRISELHVMLASQGQRIAYLEKHAEKSESWREASATGAHDLEATKRKVAEIEAEQKEKQAIAWKWVLGVIAAAVSSYISYRIGKVGP